MARLKIHVSLILLEIKLQITSKCFLRLLYQVGGECLDRRERWFWQFRQSSVLDLFVRMSVRNYYSDKFLIFFFSQLDYFFHTQISNYAMTFLYSIDRNAAAFLNYNVMKRIRYRLCSPTIILRESSFNARDTRSWMYTFFNVVLVYIPLYLSLLPSGAR